MFVTLHRWDRWALSASPSPQMKLKDYKKRLSQGEALNQDQMVRPVSCDDDSEGSVCSGPLLLSSGGCGEVRRGGPQPGVCKRTAQNLRWSDPECECLSPAEHGSSSLFETGSVLQSVLEHAWRFFISSLELQKLSVA